METVYEALREAVNALGGPKVVAARLRPEKSVDDARVWLLNCLNADRAEKLDPEQVFLLLRWAQEAGYHGAKHYTDDLTGYVHAVPVAIETQMMVAIEEARVARLRAEETERNLQTLANNPQLLATMRAANLKVEA